MIDRDADKAEEGQAGEGNRHLEDELMVADLAFSWERRRITWEVKDTIAEDWTEI